MGIKFRCPNGHKLNVKSFLAGKRGICPHCGSKVQIPEAAEAEERLIAAKSPGTMAAVMSAPAKGLADTVTFGSNFNDDQIPTFAPVVSAPVAVAVTMSNTAAPISAPTATPVPSVAVPLAAKPVPTAMPVASAPAMPAMIPGAPSQYAVMPAAPIDPLAEAPNAVWYVRPASGGQFGPARGDIMRKWLGEGRVSADSLVWRDGWADWKSASATFPQLLAPATTPAPIAISGPVSIGISDTPKSAARPRAKKQSNTLAVGMVIGLGLLAVALLAVFIAVLSGTLQT